MRFFNIFIFIHSCFTCQKYITTFYIKKLENFNNIKQEKLFPINRGKKKHNITRWKNKNIRLTNKIPIFPKKKTCNQYFRIKDVLYVYWQSKINDWKKKTLFESASSSTYELGQTNIGLMHRRQLIPWQYLSVQEWEFQPRGCMFLLLYLCAVEITFQKKSNFFI
jgi:hypothetical protein